MKVNKIVETKPWGKFEQFTKNTESTIKILTINPNSRSSLQIHDLRDEYWRVVKGTCQVQIDQNIIYAKIGDEFIIPKKTPHRLIGMKNIAQVLEISIGDFDEKDIKRLEDDYNRK